MPKATITYTPDGASAYTFTSTGATLYGAESVYEADAQDGVPRRKRTVWTLRQLFIEDTFADNAARVTALEAALAGSEGLLVIADEAGTTIVSARVRVQGVTLPVGWRQYEAIPEVKFSGVENLVAATAWDATYTPTGGSAVSLPGVRMFKGDIETSRFNLIADDRAEGVENIFIEGIIRADPALAPAQRRAFLIAQKTALESAVQQAKDGVLTFGDYSKTVRVVKLSTPGDDFTSSVSWMLTAERRYLPGDSEAHAAYKVSTKDNSETAERITTLSGTIKSTLEAAATAKRDALKAAHLTTGRMLIDSAWEEDRSDGTDGAASLRTWAFSYTIREVLPDAIVRARLSITESIDYETGIITSTYSGNVTALTSAAALARARDWSAVYAWRISSSETVNSVSEGRPETTGIFSSVDFSYVYRRRGTEVRAQVSDETTRQHFGGSTRTVSGTAVASTEAAALTLARTFKPAGVLMLSEVEGAATDYHTTGATAVFKQVSFSYTCHVTAQDFTIEYTKSVERNYKARETVTTFNGTAWGATEAECDRAIDALVSTLTDVEMDRRDTALRAKGVSGGTATAYLMSKGFSITQRAATSGSGGDDASTISAEWTVSNVYSHNHDVMIEIPKAEAHVQEGMGITIGTRTVTGSITTLDTAAGLTWARAKKPTGGYRRISDQEQEDVSTKQKPAPVRYEVRFRYSRSYKNNVAE